jgi:hypothetical protein
VTACFVPNEVPSLVKDAIAREMADLPIAHCLHPDDPSGRTALCGVEILGVSSVGSFQCVSHADGRRDGRVA